MKQNQFLLIALLLLSINVSAITFDFNIHYGDSLTISKELIFTDKDLPIESNKVYYKTDTVIIRSDIFLFEKTGGLRFEGKVLLILTGTAANPVVLKNVSKYDPTGIYWRGLSFSNGARCRVNYCQIINASCNTASTFTYSCSFIGAGASDSIIFNNVTFDCPEQFFVNKRNSAIFIKDIPSLSAISLKNININETFRFGLYFDRCYPSSLFLDRVIDRSDTMLYCNRSIPDIKISNSNFYNTSTIFFNPELLDNSQDTKIELTDNSFLCKHDEAIYSVYAQNFFKNLAVSQFIFKNNNGNNTVNVNNLCFFNDCKIGDVTVNGLKINKSHGGFKFERCSKIGKINITNSEFLNVFNQEFGILRIEGTGKDSINSVIISNNKFDTISSYFEGAVLQIDNIRLLNSIQFVNNNFVKIEARKKNNENSFEDGGIGYLRNINTLGRLSFSDNRIDQIKAKSGGVLILEGGTAIQSVSYANNTINNVDVLSGGAVQIQGTTTIDSITFTNNSFSNFNATGNGGVINILKVAGLNYLSSGLNSFENVSALNGGAIAFDSVIHINKLNVGGELSINNSSSTGDGGYIYINVENIDYLNIGGSTVAQLIKSTAKNGNGGFAYIHSVISSLNFLPARFDLCSSGGNGGVCYLDLLKKPNSGFRLEKQNIINSGSKKSGGSFYLNFSENPDSIIISNNSIGTSTAEYDGGFVALNLNGGDSVSYIHLNSNSVAVSCASKRNGGLLNIESAYKINLTGGIEINDNNCNGEITGARKGGLFNTNAIVNLLEGKCDISRNYIGSCVADTGAFVRLKLDGNGSLSIRSNNVASIKGNNESNLFIELTGNLKNLNVTDNSFYSYFLGYTTGFMRLKKMAGLAKIQKSSFSTNTFYDYQNNYNSNSSFIQIGVPIDSIEFVKNEIKNSPERDTLLTLSWKALSVETPENIIKNIKIESNKFNSKIKNIGYGGCYSFSAKAIENISIKDDAVTKKLEAKAGCYLNVSTNSIQKLVVDDNRLAGFLEKDNTTVGGAYINISALDREKASSVQNMQLLRNNLSGGMGGNGPLLFIDMDTIMKFEVINNKIDFENKECNGAFLQLVNGLGTVKLENNQFNSLKSKSSGVIISALNTNIEIFHFKQNKISNCISRNSTNGSLIDLDFNCNQLLFSNNRWVNNTSFADALIDIDNQKNNGLISIQNDTILNSRLQLKSNKKGVLSIQNANRISIKNSIFDNDAIVTGRALYLTMCDSVLIEKCSFAKFNSYKYGVAVFDSVLNCQIINSEFKTNNCSRFPNANKDYTYGGVTLRYPTNFIFDSCSFLGNSSFDYGGAISVLNSDGNFVFLKNSHLNYNTAATGAGAYCQNSNFSIDRTRFFANKIQYVVSDGVCEGVLNLKSTKDSIGYTCNIQDSRFEANQAPRYSSVVSEQYNKVSMIRNVFYNNRCIEKDGAHIQFQTGSNDLISGTKDSVVMYNNLMYYDWLTDYDNNDIECKGDETDFFGIYNCTFYAKIRTENNREKTVLRKSEYGSSKSKIKFFNSIHYKDIQKVKEFINFDYKFNYKINDPINFLDDSLRVKNSTLIVDLGCDSAIFNDMHRPPGKGSLRNDIGITGGSYNDWGDWWIQEVVSSSKFLRARFYQNSVLLAEDVKELLIYSNDKFSIKIIDSESEFIYDKNNVWIFEPDKLVENVNDGGDSISFNINWNEIKNFDSLKVTYNNYFLNELQLKWRIKNSFKTNPKINLHFYPNPANENVVIEGDLKSIKSVQLINLSGIVIRKWNENELIGRRLDVSQVEPGIYILVVGTENSRLMKKMIIE